MTDDERTQLITMLKQTLTICPEPSCCEIIRNQIATLELPYPVIDIREEELKNE